jgi:lactoylglutathione lyase
MKPLIALVTILTDDVPTMTQFYRDILGFATKTVLDDYVEFVSEGVRFSLCSRRVMEDITGGHESFQEAKNGQAFELAFPCISAAEVEQSYRDIVAKGATPIKAPATMPWGQTTAFFADPDGNIHEIFAD